MSESSKSPDSNSSKKYGRRAFYVLLGKQLKTARLRKNLHQMDLDKLATVSHSTISLTERGKRNISLGSLLSLCFALDVSLGELLAVTPENLPEPLPSSRMKGRRMRRRTK